MMRIAGINYDSIVDGVGLRDVIFLQGCKHHCEDCHNPETWSMEGGEKHTPLQLALLLADRTNAITISGGEPLLQYWDLIDFLRTLTNMRGEVNIWLYTGFEYEDIPIQNKIGLSQYVDVLVDGKFDKNLKDKSLPFRGSSNQRLINLPKSLERGEVVLENIE